MADGDLRKPEGFELELVRIAWRDYSDGELPLANLCEIAVFDFGVDVGSVTRDDLIAIANNMPVEKWSDIEFACAESLACYSCETLGPIEYVVAIFVMLCYAEAVRHGHGYVRSVLPFVISIFHPNLELGRRYHLAELVLRKLLTGRSDGPVTVPN